MVTREQVIEALKQGLRNHQAQAKLSVYSTPAYIDFEVGVKDNPPTILIDGDVDLGYLADAVLALLGGSGQ